VYRRVKRASVFFAVAAVATLAPALGPAAAVPFLALAGLVLFGIDEGPWFHTLAVQGDHEAARLYGLGAFSLALAGLAAAATIPRPALPAGAFAAAALAVGGGRLGHALVRSWDDPVDRLATAVKADEETWRREPLRPTVGSVLVGGVAGSGGYLLAGALAGEAFEPAAALAESVFIGAVAALTASLVRSVVFDRDAHLVVIIVAIVTWTLTAVGLPTNPLVVGIALIATSGLGAASYAIGAASVSGMIAGTVTLLLAAVLGGTGWFLALVTFYAVGGLASKYRFDEKATRGVAQENDGARGPANVAANSAVALAALIGFAAADAFGVSVTAFQLAFAGAVATATADTLSSEIGGLFDRPRLVTTLRPVPAGTDGAVTWQGELAGLAGATLIGLVAAVDTVGWSAVVSGGGLNSAVVESGIASARLTLDTTVVGAVALAGVGGMTVDSVLGAAIEGNRVGNQAVNFLATLSGAGVAVVAGILL